MLPKQAKFDRKCSKMRWGNLQLSPKPPNREGKPFPSYILGYATEWRTQELMMGGFVPPRLGVLGSVVSSTVGAGTYF